MTVTAPLVAGPATQARRWADSPLPPPVPRRGVQPGAIFHSDKGAPQYTSAKFARFCQAHRIRTSTGRTGVCWDNAAAESFFGALKNEMYLRQPFPARAHARFAVAGYVEVFYNRQRLHSALGYRTPLKHSPNSRLQQPLHDQQSGNCPRSLTQLSELMGCSVSCQIRQFWVSSRPRSRTLQRLRCLVAGRLPAMTVLSSTSLRHAWCYDLPSASCDGLRSPVSRADVLVCRARRYVLCPLSASEGSSCGGAQFRGTLSVR